MRTMKILKTKEKQMNKYNWMEVRKLLEIKIPISVAGIACISKERRNFIGYRIENGLYEVCFVNEENSDIYMVECDGLKDMFSGNVNYLLFDTAENAEKYIDETMQMCWDMRCFA